MARVPVDLTLRDENGRVQNGVDVYVYDRGTTDEVDVYDAESGGSLVGQPLTTNAEGQIADAWVAAGAYDINVPSDAVNPTRPWEAVQWAEAVTAADVALLMAEKFNVRDYGAVGDETTDDTAAFQAAIDAACAVHGCLYIPPAETGASYRITDTLTIEPALAGDQVIMDIVAHGYFNHIYWDGADNTEIFHSIGWKRSLIDGVKIRLQTGATNVTAWEVDISAAATSTGINTWTDCTVSANGACTDCTGWRLCHGYASGESSFHAWVDSFVHFEQAAADGCVGWRNEHNNSTSHTWIGCGISGADSFASNILTSTAAQFPGTGAGSLYFFGCGSSYTFGPTFELKNAPTLIEGGRYELGTQFLNTSDSGGKLSATYTVREIEIADFDPFTSYSGRLFDIRGAHNVTVEGIRCSQPGGGVYVQHTVECFYMVNDGAADNAAAGSLFIRGCALMAADPFYTINLGNWRVKIEGCTVIDASGQSTDFFDEDGAVSSGGTITLPPHANVITVSGTADITSITADIADRGRTATLIFSGTKGAAGLVDGSNLALASTFAYTPNDAITLVCNGGTWFETGRSVN